VLDSNFINWTVFFVQSIEEIIQQAAAAAAFEIRPNGSIDLCGHALGDRLELCYEIFVKGNRDLAFG